MIEFGWDEPDTAFMLKHVAEMEQTPFDGTVFHITYEKPDGSRGSLHRRAMPDRQVDIDADPAPLAPVEFRRGGGGERHVGVLAAPHVEPHHVAVEQRSGRREQDQDGLPGRSPQRPLDYDRQLGLRGDEDRSYAPPSKAELARSGGQPARAPNRARPPDRRRDAGW